MGARGFRTVCGLAVACSLAIASSASAATITPTAAGDEFNTGAGCSLREAVQAANTNAAFGGCPAGSPTPDEIRLTNPGYFLTLLGSEDLNAQGDLDVTNGGPVSIVNGRGGAVFIDGFGIDRQIDVRPNANLTVTGLILKNGKPSGSGGAVRNNSIFAIFDSTITGNEAGLYGGGIATAGGLTTTTVQNVTISGNRAGSGAGAFDHNDGTVTVNHSTMTGNFAPAQGGGGYVKSTVGGTATIKNTILAGNTQNAGPSDCSFAIATPSGGNNLIGSTASCSTLTLGTGDKTGNPMLAPLADNGGPVTTHALSPGSPALDAGGAGLTADARGAPRTKPDIGAYERVLCGGVLVNRIGTAGNDTIEGTPAADGILGQAGNDTLSGLSGKDGICGGAGKDKLRGGGGKDKLIGGAGKDTLIGGKGRDTCKGGGGKDSEKGC